MGINRIVGITLGMAMTVVFSSCSVIDEDLSDCGEELKELRLDYDLHLVTNLNIELQKEFDSQVDAGILKALRNYLSPIFTDYAHDLDLSFYDHQGDFARLHHEEHMMDANELSFSIYIPQRQYMHTAFANLEHNGVVSFEGGDYAHEARFLQSGSDTSQPHKTGLFSARKMLKLSEQDDNETVYVHLYMANCAAALILDTSEASLKDLKVLSTGFASGFNITDSTYVFSDNPPMILTDKINTGSNGRQCFCTVNFPSPEPAAATRVTIDTEDPFVSVDASEALWQFDVQATLPDGKVTRSVLGVRTPLRAGQLKILHARMYANGGLEPGEKEVAVSVTLDWKEAGNYPVPL